MKKNKFKEQEKKVAYDIAAPAKEEKKKIYKLAKNNCTIYISRIYSKYFGFNIFYLLNIVYIFINGSIYAITN